MFRQIGPLFRNAKTMLRVMNEFKKIDEPSSLNSMDNNSTNIKNDEVKNEIDSMDVPSPNIISDNQPSFFI